MSSAKMHAFAMEKETLQEYLRDGICTCQKLQVQILMSVKATQS